MLDAVRPGVTATGPPTDIEFTHVNGLDNSLVLHYEFPAKTSTGPATALVVVNPSNGNVIDSALPPADTTDWAYSGPNEAQQGQHHCLHGRHEADRRQAERLLVEERHDLRTRRLSPDEEARGPFELYWINGGCLKSLVIAK